MYTYYYMGYYVQMLQGFVTLYISLPDVPFVTLAEWLVNIAFEGMNVDTPQSGFETSLLQINRFERV